MLLCETWLKSGKRISLDGSIASLIVVILGKMVLLSLLGKKYHFVFPHSVMDASLVVHNLSRL